MALIVANDQQTLIELSNLTDSTELTALPNLTELTALTAFLNLTVAPSPLLTLRGSEKIVVGRITC